MRPVHWTVVEKIAKEGPKRKAKFDVLRSLPSQYIQGSDTSLLGTIERTIADEWKTLLQLPNDMQLKLDDDFFRLGGNSMTTVCFTPDG